MPLQPDDFVVMLIVIRYGGSFSQRGKEESHNVGKMMMEIKL